MCGRAVCQLAPDQLCHQCQYRDPVTGILSMPIWVSAPNGETFHPSYNIPPTKYTPILYEDHMELMAVFTVKDEHNKEHENFVSMKDVGPKKKRFIQPMRWGFIPNWYKGDVKSFNLTTNNARAENLMDKGTYKSALMRGQRCVVLAEGFYEWKRKDGSKQPYYIQLPDKGLMMMAGIYDVSGPKECPLYSYAVLTVESVGTMADIHNRIPAILETPELVNTWLDGNGTPPAKALQHCIYSVTKLSLEPVSTFVNSVSNDSPQCIAPLNTSKPKQTPLTSWLKRSSGEKDTSEEVDEKQKKLSP